MGKYANDTTNLLMVRAGYSHQGTRNPILVCREIIRERFYFPTVKYYVNRDYMESHYICDRPNCGASTEQYDRRMSFAGSPKVAGSDSRYSGAVHMHI